MKRIGQTRIKLAERLNAQFHINIEPEAMWTQPLRWGLAAWGVQVKFPDGRTRNLHSFDTMTTCLKAKKIGVIEDDGLAFEICAD